MLKEFKTLLFCAAGNLIAEFVVEAKHYMEARHKARQHIQEAKYDEKLDTWVIPNA